jgi:hypothetical protein
LGHATFCIVVVFNNIAARLRRTGSVYLAQRLSEGGAGGRI